MSIFTKVVDALDALSAETSKSVPQLALELAPSKAELSSEL
jgi:hypothetical protein